jgi:hypothetical protein
MVQNLGLQTCKSPESPQPCSGCLLLMEQSGVEVTPWNFKQWEEIVRNQLQHSEEL